MKHIHFKQFMASIQLALTLVLFSGVLGAAMVVPTQTTLAQTTTSAKAVIKVDAEGCKTDAAINSAIGQSFKLPGAARLSLEKISIWINPAQGHGASYELALLQGEGPMGVLLKISSIVKEGNLAGGDHSGWYAFAFTGVTLQPDQRYTFVLVSRSPFSGTFAQCKDIYADGMLYRPGAGSEIASDIAFQVFGVSSAAADKKIVTVLPSLSDPGAPTQELPPEIAELAAKGLLGPRKNVMPLGDSITDMPANQGPAWGGYRIQLANHYPVFNQLYKFVGSFGVFVYQSSPSPWNMVWDQRSHCGWSGATMDGYTLPPIGSLVSPGTSIIGNFWQCRTSAPRIDFILLHAGSNDLRNRSLPPGVRVELLAQKTVALIQASLQYTSAKVLVAKIIPMTGGFAEFNPTVANFNTLLEQRITWLQTNPSTAWLWKQRVRIVDMYRAFYEKTHNNPQKALSDGLHPNVPGNKIMAYEWMAALYASY